MPATKNLCAQISLELHQKISEAREKSGLTTAQYITQFLTEYYKMKENGGNTAMTNSKSHTLAFQIDEDIFLRIQSPLGAGDPTHGPQADPAGVRAGAGGGGAGRGRAAGRRGQP
jgi:hypothetical protein